MATSPINTSGSEVPQSDWLTQNWKWAVPAGFLLLLLLCALLVGSIFFLVESLFRQSDCYKVGLARARANQQVSEKIGQPITAGWLASGHLNTSGSSGDAEMSIPINGPKGKGSIYILANKKSGEWTYVRLEVAVNGEDPRIDLTTPEVNMPVEK